VKRDRKNKVKSEHIIASNATYKYDPYHYKADTLQFRGNNQSIKNLLSVGELLFTFYTLDYVVLYEVIGNLIRIELE